MKAIRVRRELSEPPPTDQDNSIKKVRLTVYTTDKKDYALRYLALKKRKSLNQLVNENFDALLQSSGIDPETLPENMPGRV
ncbi:MAG TPA: hypothetical protein VKV15_08195 [Bryobacteraceae bacterium]|nr:hypothetical protein [Bryobacteraceae bacterium]